MDIIYYYLPNCVAGLLRNKSYKFVLCCLSFIFLFAKKMNQVIVNILSHNAFGKIVDIIPWEHLSILIHYPKYLRQYLPSHKHDINWIIKFYNCTKWLYKFTIITIKMWILMRHYGLWVKLVKFQVLIITFI